MPWEINRDASALHVRIEPPMTGEWEALMDEVQSSLKPLPKAKYLPARLSGASQADADMLKILWQSLTDLGIPILSPR